MEQDLGPFNWIVTVSAGIGSWVAKKHLDKLVFDLPSPMKSALNLPIICVIHWVSICKLELMEFLRLVLMIGWKSDLG